MSCSGSWIIEYPLHLPIQKRLQKIKKQSKAVDKLKIVIEILVSGSRLGSEYRDQPLTGGWKGCRDCHIEPDWILIYKLENDTLILERTGSHSELFK